MHTFSNDWLVATEAARDFSAAYLSQREAMRQATDTLLMQSKAFGMVMQSLTSQQRELTYERYWAGIKGALEGNWQAELDAMRRVGKIFARAGATIRDWEALSGGLAEVVRTELFRRLGTDLPRLQSALGVMQHFFDRSLCVFSEAFLGAAQDHLAQSERFFRITSTGQAFVDKDGQIRKANDAFLRLYGIERENVCSRTLGSFLDPDDMERVRALYGDEWRRTGRAAYDAVHLRVDGSAFPAHVEAVNLASSEGQDVWGISVFDLTERRQVEALRHRSAELETENARVLLASQAKSAFLAQMSHELRTPLNAILGFSQLLQLGEVGPLSLEQLEFVTDIHTSGSHLLHVVNDVLDLSKVEAGKLEFDVREVELVPFVRDVTQLTRATAADSSVRVEVKVDARLARVWLDPHRLKQVLYNYLSNALKFSPTKSRVAIAFDVEDERSFRLTVSDQGDGIRAEELARLFVPFEQLEAGRARPHDSTGLGLVVTKRLVEAQGGHVGVLSAPGEGTTFFAVLPRDAR